MEEEEIGENLGEPLELIWLPKRRESFPRVHEAPRPASSVAQAGMRAVVGATLETTEALAQGVKGPSCGMCWRGRRQPKMIELLILLRWDALV